MSFQNDFAMSMLRLHQERESITVDHHCGELYSHISKVIENLDTKLDETLKCFCKVFQSKTNYKNALAPSTDSIFFVEFVLQLHFESKINIDMEKIVGNIIMDILRRHSKYYVLMNAKYAYVLEALLTGNYYPTRLCNIFSILLLSDLF